MPGFCNLEYGLNMKAYQYHKLTSYERDRLSPHTLDWENQPTLYKAYKGIEPIPLPKQISPPRLKLSDILLAESITRPRSLDITDISRLLLLSNTLTAKARHGNDEFYFRSVASAGALYPSEIYLSVQGINGLDPGLYYFSIKEHALYCLRKGEFNRFVSGLIQPLSKNIPSIVLFFTSIYFRSAWKYRDRAYRYCLLDTGHLIENVHLALKSYKISFKLSYDFNDDELGKFLGVDTTREFPLATFQVWPGPLAQSAEKMEDINPLPDELQKTSIVSPMEKRYEKIEDIHSQGSAIIHNIESKGTIPFPFSGSGLGAQSIAGPASWPDKMDYKDALFRRRSSRNFIHKGLDSNVLSAMLLGICTPDVKVDHMAPLFVGMLVGEGQHFEAGFYTLDCEAKQILFIKKGEYNSKMAAICLDQAWLSNAAIHFLFLGDLRAVDKLWGPRGYRYALLTAGRLGERIYLMATAMGLGCCGIGAFYDEEASEILDLNDNASLFYLVAAGHVKRSIAGHV